MEYPSIEQCLSLLTPYFSGTSTHQEDAATIGRFLSATMRVDSVTLIRFERESCAAADWFASACGEATGRMADLLQGDGRALLACIDARGVGEGKLRDLLKLTPDMCAMAHVIDCAKRPWGCFVACRRGDDWSEAERRLFSTVRDLMGAASAMRVSMENERRTSFVFNTVVNAMKASIYVTEVDTDRILFMNQAMKEDFGICDPEGKICYKVLQEGMRHRCGFCPVNLLAQSGEDAPMLEWDEVNKKTGRSYRNYDSLIRWMDGSIVHLQQSIDVTDLKAANTDELTQLLNRRPGKSALQDTLERAREEGRPVTVCLYDINNLKAVNDQFGHAQGDRLITSATETVQDFLRDGEYAFRMSGDEFVVVFLSGQKDAQRRMAEAQNKLRTMDEKYDAGFCFGLVEVLPEHVVSAEDALLYADERMYEQKRRFHIARNARRLRLIHSSRSGETFQYDKDLLYDALAKSTDAYPFICNMKTGVFRYAPAMVEEFGLPGEVIENAAAVWGAKVHESDRPAFLEANQMVTDGRAMSHCVEYRAINRHGEWIWVRCRGQVEVDENNEPSLFAGFISKLDEKNKFDRLTGLLNKLAFEESIHRHIQLFPGVPLGVVVLGLDDLKHVNELYDRAFGDEVIRITAQRLQALLPAEASLYRLDGDEFGVVVQNVDHEEVQAICRTIGYCFEGQQEHNGRKFYCTLSGGSILFPRDAGNYLDIAKYASYCLSLAKHRGKNCYIAYSPGIWDHRARALEIVEMLRSSVTNGFEGFSLRYQPLVQASSGRVLGAEALLRWNDARFGQVSPVEFIPLLEQTGMIIPVGKWVLATAIRQCAPWLQVIPGFSLNVNLSYLQVQGSELAPFVLRTLEENQFPSQNLVLELTESHFVRDNRHVQDIFDHLREHGVCIAVDDFGTGFSSLSLLKNIPADIVKIDRAFIRDILTSSFDATFVRFVVALCHDVGISVCLEGVETHAEYQIVSAMGLDMIQGYLFGRPSTAEDFMKNFFPQ